MALTPLWQIGTVNIGKMFLGMIIFWAYPRFNKSFWWANQSGSLEKKINNRVPWESPLTIVGMCAVRSLPSFISHPVQNLEVEGEFGAKGI